MYFVLHSVACAWRSICADKVKEQGMREVINLIFSTWQSYWSGSWYPYLLVAAVLWIVAESIRYKKNTEKACAVQRADEGITLALYTLLMLAVFFFPVTAWILQKCIGAEVYWRVLWAVPVVPLLAYTGTRLVRMSKKRIAQAAVLAVMLGVTVISGKSIYDGNYSRVHNYQQVPDEVAHVCNLINAHRGDGDALLATDNNLSPYIRVYDPSIRMPYGRLGRGAKAEIDRTIYHDINFESDKYAEIAQNAKHRGCTYLAICIYNEEQQKEIEAEGYVLLDFVNQYGVFALDKTEES